MYVLVRELQMMVDMLGSRQRNQLKAKTLASRSRGSKRIHFGVPASFDRSGLRKPVGVRKLLYF